MLDFSSASTAYERQPLSNHQRAHNPELRLNPCVCLSSRADVLVTALSTEAITKCKHKTLPMRPFTNRWYPLVLDQRKQNTNATAGTIQYSRVKKQQQKKTSTCSEVDECL